MEQNKYRLFFTKKGNIKYISHLDLTKVFARAFSRAGLPLKHSEGFTPHPKISFELPLSVGMESVCESCDFTLAFFNEPGEIVSRLNAQLPDGLFITDCVESDAKFPKAEFADYEIRFFDISKDEAALISDLLKGEIVINKRTKKGSVLTDITNKIRTVDLGLQSDTLILNVTLPCSGEDYLNPEYICRFICENESFKEKRKIYSIMRKNVYLKK